MPPARAIHPFQATYNLPAVTVIADAGYCRRRTWPR